MGTTKHPIRSLTGAAHALAVALVGCGRSDPAAVDTSGAPEPFHYESVATNRDVAVPEGFRGDEHPLLHGETGLELTARWKPTLSEAKRSGIKLGIIDNKSSPEYSIPEDVVRLLTESTVAVEHATYGARELSAFLPEEITGVGQMWKIDPARAAAFLEQFHPRVSTTFDRYDQPYGRRPGPAGAFGILRASSADYLEVLFRVHAEFDLSEGAILYTPACFLGRMLVDRRAGTVASLEMRVPTDKSVNVDITLAFKLPQRPRKQVSNIVFEHVDPMQLSGGDAELSARIDWQDEIELEDAHHRLKSAFYKFMDVDWVPPEKMIAIAREAKKPIVVVVLTSPLDDQSC